MHQPNFLTVHCPSCCCTSSLWKTMNTRVTVDVGADGFQYPDSEPTESPDDTAMCRQCGWEGPAHELEPDAQAWVISLDTQRISLRFLAGSLDEDGTFRWDDLDEADRFSTKQKEEIELFPGERWLTVEQAQEEL